MKKLFGVALLAALSLPAGAQETLRMHHFVPPKAHFRSDTVDSQRGEVEWSGGNLYFDRWDYDFQWKVLPRSGEVATSR